MSPELKSLVREIVLEVLKTKAEEDCLTLVKPSFDEKTYREKQTVLNAFDEHQPRAISQVYESVKSQISRKEATVRRWCVDFLSKGLIAPVYKTTKPKFVRTRKETAE